MSVCWQIVCKETKQQLWCGQSSYLYKTPEAIELLEMFLKYHEYKTLRVENDLHWDHDDEWYTDWAGQSCDWEIFCNGVSLGVYEGDLLQAIKSAVAEKYPTADFYSPTMYCSAGDITFNPITVQE